MRTNVVIVGGGPSGLLLSRLLSLDGIDNVVLEKQSEEHVTGRIRAGVLENGTIEMLEKAGVSDRLKKEGFLFNSWNKYFILFIINDNCRMEGNLSTARRIWYRVRYGK